MNVEPIKESAPKRLAERLRAEGLKAVEFFQALAPDQWDLEVYTEGSCWAVRQVLAHFLSAELSLAKLIENVAGGGSGTPEDFRLDEYNERKVARLAGLAPDEILRQFEEARLETVHLVESLDPASLTNQGRHPFLGQAPLEEMIKLVYRHNQIHLRDVRKRLAAQEAPE